MLFLDDVEAPYRDGLSSQTDRWGQQRLVIRDFDPAKPATLAHRADADNANLYQGRVPAEQTVGRWLSDQSFSARGPRSQLRAALS